MIDYKVGDWVETCHIMPGIVQSVDVKQPGNAFRFSFLETKTREISKYPLHV